MAPTQAGKRRSETVSVRLDPKLRYLSDLAARKQRRTLSSFVEWAIEVSLDRVILEEAEGIGQSAVSIGSISADLWDVDPGDRFAKLAFRYPELLTHEEQILWKLMRTHGYFWKNKYDSESGAYRWKLNEDSLRKDRLREYWETLNQIAAGELDEKTLPRLHAPKLPVVDDPTIDDIAPMDDDEIPF